MRPLVLVVLALLGLPTLASGQEIGAAVSPETVTVGDVARVGVRVRLPAGGRAAFPDSLDVTGEIENAGRMESLAEEHPDGGRTVTAVYPVTAWRPGVDTLPPVPVTIEIDGVTRTDTVALPPLVVVSVLPPDTAGIEARPPKDVIGPAWVWWIWLLIGLAVLGAIALLVWWVRRRRRNRPAVVMPLLSARERALGELDAIRAERMYERPSIEPFYERVSAVLRAYLAEVDPVWGRYRTTSELTVAVLPAASPEMAARLRALLREADAVKFAAASPDAGSAPRHFDQVRSWIEGFPPPAAPTQAESEPERAA